VEKKKKLAPLPPTHTPGLDQKMFECIASPPHRLNREQQGISILPTYESTPRTRLSFTTSNLANSPVNGNIANYNPFARNIGETVRTDILHKQLEDPGEGWTFQGKKKLPIKILSPRHDLAQNPTRSPQPTSTPGGKRGQTHSELHHSYFESLGISVPVDQEFCKVRIWPVLSREKDERKQILVHARNQIPPDLPLSIRITGLPEERWTQVFAQKDLVLRLEAELEKKILRYKMAVKDNLHVEWCWQAEPGRGGMECTILAHI
jgi:hypothetical protein